MSLKSDISLFIKHIRSKIKQSVCRKYLQKDLEEVIFGYQQDFVEFFLFMNLIWGISA